VTRKLVAVFLLAITFPAGALAVEAHHQPAAGTASNTAPLAEREVHKVES